MEIPTTKELDEAIAYLKCDGKIMPSESEQLDLEQIILTVLIKYKDGHLVEKPLERFKKPTDQQIIEMAVIYNDGKINVEQLTNMVALCETVIDRLYDNGDIMVPSKKENEINAQS